MKKQLLKLREKIIHFGPIFERYTKRIWYKRRIKRDYVTSNSKIDKQYTKQIKAYWNKYTKINMNFHRVYSNISGNKDVRYVPDYIYYYYIEPYFNKMKSLAEMDDKNYYHLYMPDLVQPETVIKNVDGIFYKNHFDLITAEMAVEAIKHALKEEGKVLIKPSIETGGGMNVHILHREEDIEKTLEQYGTNYIVQKVIKQSEIISKIHKSSINTVRIISLLYKNDVIILSSILRIGTGGNIVDGGHYGGIRCGIDADGRLKEKAYDERGNGVTKHPTSGLVFKGYKIEGYDKIVKIIKEEHKKWGHFQIISWDFALDEKEEPIFIEFNIKAGSIDFHQYINGPLFGDLTDEILEEVFHKK